MPKPILRHTDSMSTRIGLYNKLMSKVVVIPDSWLEDIKPGAVVKSDTIRCESYKELTDAWKGYLKWTVGLDCALGVMLAASASTTLIGEQLWFKIIGPPSCGKTTLLEGLAVNKRYVLSKDTIRGFYQGWRDENKEDMSIAAMARGKTLATKDGDTLLKTPNLQQILSEGRGLYDRVGRTHYRNGVMNDYEGHRMTWLLCGTSALREIDESELGNRFLDVVVMDEIDDEFEREVAWMAAKQESRCMLAESDGKLSSQHPKELAVAMQKTGGYLNWLRKNMLKELGKLEVSDEVLEECGRLGKLVAHLRARPHRERRDVEATREFSGRLVKQHVRLAQSLAVVLNRPSVDRMVMRRVHKVSLDTSRGVSKDIVDLLRVESRGKDATGISMMIQKSIEDTSRMLKFLRAIKVVRSAKVEVKGSRPKIRWFLTKKFKTLLTKTW